MLPEQHTPVKNNDVMLIAAVLSVGIFSTYLYHSILGYFFTGTDTITLIDTSRIRSIQDVTRLFTEPLMAGSKFVDIARFFRPFASLSYSIDYAVWHLNPFGFQLTNLLLNSLAACLVVVVMYSLSNRNLLFSWLSGLVFALHPILVDSVPATDRRHDMIAGVFVLLSLFLFLKSRPSGSNRKWLISGSLLSYVVALGGKEIAIILPLIILVHVLTFSKVDKWLDRFFEAIRQAFPYFMVTAIYLIWRTLVLRGLGGYLTSEPSSWDDIQTYVINIFQDYFLDLVYPADPLRVFDTSIANYWIFLILAVFTFYWLLFLRSLHPEEEIVHKGQNKRLSVFLLSWLMAPLILFVVTLTFAHRSMYIPAIPFSALLAYPLAEGLKRLINILSRIRSKSDTRLEILKTYRSELTILTLGLSMFSFLLLYSPLLRSYDQWEASGRIGRLVLTKLASGTRHLNQDCRVNLYNLPSCLRSYEKKEPKAKDVTYLSDYSIKSWLNLCGFKKKLDVIIRTRSQPWDLSGELSVAILRLGKQNLRAIVRIKPLAKKVGPVW
ncbi:MAG: hypothetical protein ACP5U1_00755 [Desulfomonilaceae bacterium]